MSQNQGENLGELSIDHKPDLQSEKNRIQRLGGKIYQTEIPVIRPATLTSAQRTEILKGPYRVFPGRLSVSRAFGDPESKIKKYGGIPGVVIAEPEIIETDIVENRDDFLLLGCDGIFDKMKNSQIIKYFYEVKKENNSVHSYIGKGINNILQQCFMRRSYDNVTILVIAFKNLEIMF